MLSTIASNAILLTFKILEIPEWNWGNDSGLMGKFLAFRANYRGKGYATLKRFELKKQRVNMQATPCYQDLEMYSSKTIRLPPSYSIRDVRSHG